MNRDDELQRFKTDIDLIEYCAGCGFEIDRSETSRTSTIMRRGSEKIGVAVDIDGHWVYSDLRADGKGGSIIDFVQSTQGLNLGQVRKELRGARVQIEQIPIARRAPKPQPSQASRQAVQHAYIKTCPTAGRHAYLERERYIDARTLSDPRFASMVRSDPRGNAIFPHCDELGITGYEIRNTDFKGFSAHGEKTLWVTSNLEDAPEVIFVEGAINALSYDQLHPNPLVAYVSIAGQMSQRQKQLVSIVMIEAAKRGAVIVFATDGDAAGEAHAQLLKSLAPVDAALERHRPPGDGDWNDRVKEIAQLHQRQAATQTQHQPGPQQYERER